MEGKTARGASSPAKPALHIPDPLSTTSACTSSSAIFYISTTNLCRKNPRKSQEIQQQVNDARKLVKCGAICKKIRRKIGYNRGRRRGA